MSKGNYTVHDGPLVGETYALEGIEEFQELTFEHEGRTLVYRTFHGVNGYSRYLGFIGVNPTV